MLEGRARILGDNISGDHIISKEYIRLGLPVPQMVPYLFKVCRPDLGETLTPGDMIVAGENFGCGSSREYVMLLLREAGIRCIVARSFARGFYRSCINQGLLPIACTIQAQENDLLSIDLDAGTIAVNGKNSGCFDKFPPLILQIMADGGLINYYLKREKLG